jgi:hypothetical protein
MKANLDEFGEANELNVSRLLLLLLCIVISHIFLPSGCSLRCQKLRNKEMYKKEKKKKEKTRIGCVLQQPLLRSFDPILICQK